MRYACLFAMVSALTLTAAGCSQVSTAGVSTDELSVLVTRKKDSLGGDTPRTERIPLAELDVGVSRGGGVSSMSISGGVACYKDEEGRWQCKPLPRVTTHGPSFGWSVSRKDASTLMVDIDFEEDGESQETSGRLPIEPGRRVELRLPPEGDARWSCTFEIVREPAEKPGE